jgi:LysR family transcriptional regulator, hydrogen peroxide-inducible genes activator
MTILGTILQILLIDCVLFQTPTNANFMNLQQLEYIVAIDAYRHFAKAAEACFVTQPTLSMMVQKLEEELGVKIFDRSRQPVVPTLVGEALVAQARLILGQVQQLKETVNQQKNSISGEFSVGIIPTLAPYLIPLFIKSFLEHYPNVRLRMVENTTEVVVEKLKKGQLDAGILVTPLHISFLKETPIFYEAFVVYSSYNYPKEYLLPEDLNPNDLWLLQEGHCFRSQIMNLCELRRMANAPFEYEASSIETLKQLVDSQSGITILPDLATLNLDETQRQKVKRFAAPQPVREVSIVTQRDYVKQRLVDALQVEILANLPANKIQEQGDRVAI